MALSDDYPEAEEPIAPAANAVAVVEPEIYSPGMEPIPTTDAAAEKAMMIARANATTLAARLNYDGDLSEAVLVAEIRVNFKSIDKSMLEIGKNLLILKELTPHGKFLKVVESFGISQRTAWNWMNATARMTGLKCSNVAAMQQLGNTKLIDMMVLDDDQLEELAEGGSVAGKTLDDIERMSSRQLREHLRNTRALTKTLESNNEQLASEKNQLKNRLDAKAALSKDDEFAAAERSRQD
ncbi:MAG: hypothetical protein ORO03_09635 [Alphaproteobacteria bacterium]|nr:hypothetical protein [Alphaproteobacteria bacterium]